MNKLKNMLTHSRAILTQLIPAVLTGSIILPRYDVGELGLAAIG